MDILSARKKAAQKKAEKRAIPEQPSSRTDIPEERPADADGATRKPDAEVSRSAAPETQPVQEIRPETGKQDDAEMGIRQSETLSREADQQVGEDAEVTETGPSELEMLTFRLGREMYAVPIEDVREVTRLWAITPVPNSPEYVLGVTTLRGTVLPVIDLCKRLGTPAGQRDEKSRIVVVNINEENTGIAVDRVQGVIRISEDEIRPAPENIEQAAGAEYLKGIFRKGDKLYIILDLDKAAGL